MSRVASCLVGLLLGCALTTGPLPAADDVIPIGSKRELFIDRHLISDMKGATLKLHHPQDAGIALKFDKPWEGEFSGYVTVIKDGDLFRAYYRGNASKSPMDGNNEESTCYAESKDGIHWERPKLTRFQSHGQKETNIVFSEMAPLTHNFSPFLDLNPQAKPDERYKAVAGIVPDGLFVLVSADGLNWKKMQEKANYVDKGWVFDSQNVLFWSEAEQQYVLYYRKAAGGKRSIARATSKDLVHWTSPVQMMYSNTNSTVPANDLYTSQTHPYFRAPHIYLATAARFMPKRQVLTDEQADQIGVHKRYFGDTSDAVLMTTRGGDRYDCAFEQGFLRPGVGYSNWVSRTNYPALNLVQTGPAEMSMYVNQDYGQPTAHLRRYTLRLDGLGSISAGVEPGTVVTHPITFSGSQLALNFSTSAAGGVKVEIQNPDGTPIPGFTLDDCVEQIGNEIERIVRWKNSGTDLSSLAGKPVRLKFWVCDADLYAFQFSESGKSK